MFYNGHLMLIFRRVQQSFLGSVLLRNRHFIKGQHRSLTLDFRTRHASCYLCSTNGAVAGKFAFPHSLAPRLFPSTQVRWKKNPYPPLNEEELEQKSILGGGPGGQSINRTASCAQLKHLPTGIVVKCQETRSIHQNMEKARFLMQEKLDWHYNGENSIKAREIREARQKGKQKEKRNRERQEQKRAFKEKFGFQ